MNFTPTTIPDVIVVEPRVFGDNRGYFFESYRKDVFAQGGIGIEFVQDNQSFSKKGTLRGLHFQRPPFAQSKLVRCVEGAIWDVAVDIRPHSPTFGKWVAEELSAENHKMLFIPGDFAHGFVVLSETAVVQYKCDNVYDKASEGSVKWDDPDLAIEWPLDGLDPLLSEKDTLAPPFSSLT